MEEEEAMAVVTAAEVMVEAAMVEDGEVDTVTMVVTE